MGIPLRLYLLPLRAHFSVKLMFKMLLIEEEIDRFGFSQESTIRL